MVKIWTIGAALAILLAMKFPPSTQSGLAIGFVIGVLVGASVMRAIINT